MTNKMSTRSAFKWVAPSLLLSVLFFALIFVSLGIRHTVAAEATQATAVDGQVKISYSGLTLNRSTNTFDTVATLTNVGSTVVSAPVTIEITSITPGGIQLANGSGTTQAGLAYLNVLTTGSFNPGATLTPIVLKFSNPSRVGFTFTQSIFGVVASANHPPVANAGPDQTVATGTTVQLDGTASTDVDGNALTYRWTLVTKPSGSQANLANTTAVNPSFVADLPGSYSIQLIASDGQVDSTLATVHVSTVNSPPVAHAGPDQTIAPGTVVLDGSHSTDVDGDALSYQWSLVSAPAGSTAQLANPTTVKSSLTADKSGSYVLQLIVNDGHADSAPATVTVSTQNSVPVANAGPDQHTIVGTAVRLDGSNSSDADSDALTYRWALITLPSGSGTALLNPAAVNPSFVVDKSGIYVAQLIVNDGHSDSQPATVVITTSNTRPVANAGPNQSATAGQAVTLDGTLSSDADNDTLTFAWSLLAKPATSAATLSNARQAKATFASDLPGIYVAQLIVSDGQLNSQPATSTVTITVAPPNQNPQISSAPIAVGQQGVAYSYQVLASDPDRDPLSYALTVGAQGMTISSAGLITWTPSSSGTFPISIKVSDGRGGSATQSYNLVIAAAAVNVPNVVGLTQAAATAAITSANLVVGTVTQQASTTVAAGTVISEDPAAGTAVAQGSAVNLVVSQVTGLPPDPATVAPPVDPTVATTIAAATSFLYSGSNPIQTGVAAGTIDVRRAAVIRGTVLGSDNQPLSGVKIAVLNHAEFGQTLSRLDGNFDLAVNGGGPLTVTYQKSGFISAQRQVQAPWQDWVIASDVVMIGYDTKVTTVNLGAPTMQAARGNAVSDSDGTRQATVLFPQGTTATMTLPNGNTQPLTTVSVRASEFTVGPNGPKQMPAALPPTSGYTYAVELSVDEAVAANASTVTFSQAVPFYVENFLNFPVGMAVPVGYYDRGQGVWVPSPNGLVIKIASVTNGRADLIIGSAGTIASTAELTALGVTDAEQVQLAGLYPAGQTLWRVPITHFTPWDCNWPYGPPAGATPPNQPPPVPGGNRQDKSDCEGGSIIDCQNQVLRERIGIAGTPFSLNYSSDRVPGYRAGSTIDISLSGASVPSALSRIDLTISIAGKVYAQTFPATANQRYVFMWDGTDAYGRLISGQQQASIDIGYVYGLVAYQTPAAVALSFAQIGGAFTADRGRLELTLHQITTTSIAGRNDERPRGLGAWSLDLLHYYDPTGQVLHLGDGTWRSAQDISLVIRTFAGNGQTVLAANDGAPATSTSLVFPSNVAVDASGNVYVTEDTAARVRKIDPSGIITTIAGTGQSGFSGDGGPATSAKLGTGLGGVVVDPGGNVYLADGVNRRIRKVDRAGIITTIAGTGAAAASGDGGPAIAAGMSPTGMFVDVNGNLYIADYFNDRVRKIDSAGIIVTVAGNGSTGFSGDGGAATLASLNRPNSVVIDAQGNLYISDSSNHRVRKVDPAGIITTIAGNGGIDFNSDGGPATAAPVVPAGVALDVERNLYISDSYNNRIRKVDVAGIITTIAGDQVNGFGGDGGPPTQASLSQPSGVAVDAARGVYIVDNGNIRVRKVSSVLPGVSTTEIAIPSDTGAELYVFDVSGRHLRTMNALTGALLYQFSYDSAGRLNQLQDGNGNITAIAHDAGGNPTSITGPDRQITTLSVDSNGYVAAVTDPAGETTQLTYSADGLLRQFKNPRGYASIMQYDSLGRLVQDQNAADGGWSLARTQSGPDFTVTMSSALGRTTTYRLDELASGDQLRTDTYPDGTVSSTTISGKSIYTTTASDGTITKLTQGPDPRFSMQAPITSELKITTPSSLVATTTTTSTAALSDPNNLLSLTSATDVLTINGRRFTTTYNAAAKQFITTSAAGRQRLVNIDALGHVVVDQVPGIDALDYAYDARGRLSTVTEGNGVDQRVAQLSYDGQGYLASITDPTGRNVRFQYDLAGRVTLQTLPDGRIIQYVYDPNGNLTSITPPIRPSHAFAYTPVDLQQLYTPPLAADTGTLATSYLYNLDKQVTKISRPDAQTADFAYDSGGRLATLTTPIGVTTFVYSPSSGKLSTMTAPGAVALGFSYDGLLLTGESWTGPVTGAVTRTYNADFKVTGLSVKGTNITFAYDQDSLLTQAGNLAISRNPTNGLVTGTTLGSATTNQTYNTFAELQSTSAAFSGVPLYSAMYTRDKLARTTQKVETIQGTTDTYGYTYDLAGRLTQVTKDGSAIGAYTYDGNGNRLTANGLGAAYDDQDRLLSYAGSVFTYTANGELSTKTAGGQTTRYVYDVTGNLRQVALPSGNVIDYLIDGRNRRVGKELNGALVQAFLYQDLLNPVAELDGASNVISRFVYGTRSNVPDYMIKGGVTYRFVTDQLNSPRLIVNTSTGAVVQRLDFDEFGVVTLDTNPGFQPFGFAGGIYDQDTRLTRFGARDYDAQLARWTVKDPVRFQGGDVNLYAYVGENPVDNTDRFGLWSIGLGLWAGLGAEFTIGYDTETSQIFGCVKTGVGVGGGVSVDPLGGRPGGGERSSEGGLTIGGFGEVGGEAGGIGGKISLSGGGQLGGRSAAEKCKAQTRPSGYGRFEAKSSLGQPEGIHAVAAAGIEGCLFGASR